MTCPGPETTNFLFLALLFISLLNFTTIRLTGILLLKALA